MTKLTELQRIVQLEKERRKRIIDEFMKNEENFIINSIKNILIYGSYSQVKMNDVVCYIGQNLTNFILRYVSFDTELTVELMKGYTLDLIEINTENINRYLR